MNLPKEVNEQLRVWKKKHKLNKQQSDVLLECFRRAHMFHNGVLDSSLGLVAFPSEVKQCKEYVIPSYRTEIPRTANWYKLTINGRILVDGLMKIITWNENTMNYNLYISNSNVWTRQN